MKKIFTFGILTYNQENEIVYTLNSIQHQILEYGRDYSCNLIITDDCSKDRTVAVCNEWVENNRDLFAEVTIKVNAHNVGTVCNYNYILSRIDTGNFKIIAGDDLIARNNIFVQSEQLENYELFCGLKMMFCDNQIFVDYDIVYMQFYLMKKKFSRLKILHLFKLGFVISTPQTLYRKKLYIASEAIKFNSKFKLFEDNPTWYSMLKNVNDMIVSFGYLPVTLYRISEKSVSNSNNSVNTVFRDELNEYYDAVIQESTCLERIYIKALKKDSINILNISKYIKKIFLIRCKIYSLLHKSEFEKFRALVEREIYKEQKFLNMMLDL